jgi:uncharacterized protein YlxW (UPF0749 family)
VTTSPTREGAPRRVDGSMSLLNDMMANTLDEAYLDRAARKAGQAAEPAPPAVPVGTTIGRRAVSVLVLVALGAVTGSAIAQVRARQEANSGLRADLAAEVRERSEASEQLAAVAEQLRAEVAAAQEAVLGAAAAGRRIAERLSDLAVAAGTAPVRGNGVVVRLDDPSEEALPGEGELRDGATPDRRISDRDLQALTNALWAAGAEAISINGQRLTALTAIRSAGETVLVDFRPLSPPYVVQAVGDPAELEIELLDGPIGRALATYVSAYGIGFDVRRKDDLSLPGAATPELRYVERGESS